MVVTFPNESPDYRKARNALLKREAALRRELEAVAAERRALPPGPVVADDYLFDAWDDDGQPIKVRLSELFRKGSDTLLFYHYMFPRDSGDDRPRMAGASVAALPLGAGPCPSCTLLLDQWDCVLPYLEGADISFATVAKAPIEHVMAFARDRGWRNITLVSAAGNDFKRDFHGEDEKGEQQPILTIFQRDADGVIRLSWASELLYEPLMEPDQDPRHLGTVEPFWGFLDLTPRGRPKSDRYRDHAHCDPGKAGPAKALAGAEAMPAA
ncbi:MAG TPA: DUF899 family protein [Allosphingosinicella sp.]|nr:DUF899 family protein [Allosphingosinicella sp.]